MSEEQESLLISMSEEQQESLLIYSFVARGAVILAESYSSSFSGNNFKTTALQFLEKLPSSLTNNKFTYTHEDGHTFSYLVDHGFNGFPIIFLERVKDKFIKRYGGEKTETAAANSLDQEFGPELKQHMEFCVENHEEMSKLAQVKAEQDEEMLETIDKILARSATVCRMLDGTTNDLRLQAQDFREVSSRIRRKMWLRSLKTKVVVLGTFVSLVLVLVLSIRGSFDCTKN